MTTNPAVIRDNVTPTLWGGMAQSALNTGIPNNIMTLTTLNEKFDIQAGVMPPQNSFQTFGYFAIGNGAHYSEVGKGGVSKNKFRVHKATDGALFNQLPFVLREINNDLSPAQRARYAFRREEVHNGNRYYAYYLRRIDKLNLTIEAWYTTIKDGVPTTTKYVPDSSVLNPKPDDIGPPVQALADKVSSSSVIDLSLTADDVAELVNVCNIIYGDPDYAIVSELATVMAVDRDVTVSSGTAGTFNFREAIAAQVSAFVNFYQDLNSANNGIELNVDVGRSIAVWKTK